MAKEAVEKTKENMNAIAKRKTRLVGNVVSDKMMQTVVVAVTRTSRHPLYKKTIKHTKKYKAQNMVDAKMGDRVIIEEIRPVSKDTRFAVRRVLETSTPIIEIKEEESDLDLLLGLDKNKESEGENKLEETTEERF